jgi:hypothetical protein
MSVVPVWGSVNPTETVNYSTVRTVPRLPCRGRAIYGGFFIDKLGQAANSGNCLRVRYTTVGGVPAPNGIYNDNSEYCKK